MVGQIIKKVPKLSLEERKKVVLERVGSSANLVHASQLQTLLRLYSKMQDHVFYLMATDSVPRFVRDPTFVEATQSFAAQDGFGMDVHLFLDLDNVRAV